MHFFNKYRTQREKVSNIRTHESLFNLVMFYVFISSLLYLMILSIVSRNSISYVYTILMLIDDSLIDINQNRFLKDNDFLC